jgi:hypothetical protein
LQRTVNFTYHYTYVVHTLVGSACRYLAAFPSLHDSGPQIKSKGRSVLGLVLTRGNLVQTINRHRACGKKKTCGSLRTIGRMQRLVRHCQFEHCEYRNRLNRTAEISPTKQSVKENALILGRWYLVHSITRHLARGTKTVCQKL